jgi:hypothetical protein
MKNNWDWVILSVIALISYHISVWLVGHDKSIGAGVYTILAIQIIRFGREVK